MAFVSKNSNAMAISHSSNQGGQGGPEKRRSRTLAKQQQISESIAGVSSQILDNAQESVSAIEQLKSSMEQIATAAEENSGASEQALDNVRVITKNIDRMTQSIDTVIRSTLSTGDTISNAVERVDQTVERMQNAVHVAQEASKKSEELKVSSQSIGEAVGLIAKIADQTNLLALNAAIEASRAKEHGKGFAVVADETRALAGESEKSAEYISTMVNKIQENIDSITTNIVNTTNIIDGTGQTGSKLSFKMEELKKIAIYTVEAARNIHSYTQRLQDVSSSIRSGSQNITEASAQIALAVDRTLNGIEMQSGALAQTESDIKELNRLADDLKYSTDTIKTAEDIASSADQISASTEDIQSQLSEVNIALNDIESQSNLTNQSALNNKENLDIALENVNDINSLIMIARRNFDILKVSFSEVKSILINVKRDTTDSIKEGESGSGELETTIKEIKNVNKTVGSISKSIIQLNMLAISGSIESARAGDFGKGFAVVSSDIRNLAKDSETNTDKIYDIVESMNSEINTVENDWLVLLQGQESENKNIDSVINDMDKIAERLVDLLDRFQGLKTINDQNTEGINTVLKGITEIQKAVELSARNAMESRKAGELLVDTISSMTENVEELAAMADELQQG